MILEKFWRITLAIGDRHLNSFQMDSPIGGKLFGRAGVVRIDMFAIKRPGPDAPAFDRQLLVARTRPSFKVFPFTSYLGTSP
jgi:hypothetical protein